MSLLSGLLRFRSRSPGLVCQEVVELVTDYLKGHCTRRNRRRFEAHLAACPHCTEYLGADPRDDPAGRAGRAGRPDASDAHGPDGPLPASWRAEG